MSKVLQLKTSPTVSRAARVRALLKDRDKAEEEIAAILREQLDDMGEAKWLAWCEREFGWARTSAYRHLNPKLLEKAKHAQAKRRANVPTLERRPEQDEPGIEDEIEAEDQENSGELAAANRGWYNRAREAAQYASYAPADTCPSDERTIEAIKDAIAAWSDVLSNVTERK